jgi:uncharacterized protein (TIGR04141 family)
VPYQTLRVVLFSVGTDLETALRQDAPAQPIGVRQNLGFDARLYLAPERGRQPRWLSYLAAATDETLPSLRNQLNGGVVLIQVTHRGQERVLGFTFGSGRTLVELDRIEHDFGLRVVLNSVDPDRLRSVETKVFDDLVLHTARQASRSSPTVTFDIDDTRDLLRAVTGVPRDQTFARRIGGSDSLVMSTNATLDQIGDLSERLLEFYGSDEFKVAFGFIDHVRAIRDKHTIERLDQQLEAAVRDGPLVDTDLHLAPPEVIDFNVVDGFFYPGERRDRDAPHDDLVLADFLVAVGRANATVPFLHRARIRAVDSAGADVSAWPAYNCLVHEVRDGADLSMLSEGQWFRVNGPFAAQVDDDVRAVATVDLGWPTAGASEVERDYNERVVATVPDLAKFDLVPIRIPGARTPIEICDVLARDRLVHVKRRTTSATLSHLFAQGRVAAEAFRFEPAVWDQMRRHLGPGHVLAATIPTAEPAPDQFEIVFAVVAKNAADLPQGLPFFSKLNLARTAKTISRTLGYRVAFASIQET